MTRSASMNGGQSMTDTRPANNEPAAPSAPAATELQTTRPASTELEAAHDEPAASEPSAEVERQRRPSIALDFDP